MGVFWLGERPAEVWVFFFLGGANTKRKLVYKNTIKRWIILTLYLSFFLSDVNTREK